MCQLDISIMGTSSAGPAPLNWSNFVLVLGSGNHWKRWFWDVWQPLVRQWNSKTPSDKSFVTVKHIPIQLDGDKPEPRSDWASMQDKVFPAPPCTAAWAQVSIHLQNKDKKGFKSKSGSTMYLLHKCNLNPFRTNQIAVYIVRGQE